MRFIPHTEDDVRDMLRAIGAPSVDALFECVPEKLRLGRPLALAEAASEQEVLAELAALAERNDHAGALAWFLGAGTYHHFVPSAVDALVSRGEFYTAYTPYQAEISQGTLQAIFEWQTMLCALTGLEVANASMYDGASATAEAALMALRITRRRKVAVSAGLHPSYRRVLETYLGGLDAELVELPRDASGATAPLAAHVDEQTACAIVQQPNFLGAVEDLAAASAAVRARGALLVACTTEALSLALLARAGRLRRRRRLRRGPELRRPDGLRRPAPRLPRARGRPTSARCRAASSGPPRTRTGGAASCSRSRPASSTSAASARRRTFARTRASAC